MPRNELKATPEAHPIVTATIRIPSHAEVALGI